MLWARRLACLLAVPAVTLGLPAVAAAHDDYRVLVFTKAVDGQHASTWAGARAIEDIGDDRDFDVTVSDNAARFTEASLKRYRTVVFLNTSGDVLTDAQQAAFEEYFRDGGGFVGIHSAIETEPGWQFFTDILGTRAEGSSAVTQATIEVADRVHEASEDLPEYWTRTDQWYNFTENVRGRSHVLATVDERTYTGGTDGFDHPVAWCKDYQGGRSFYTAGGDTPATFSERNFRKHLGGAIEWAAGEASPTYSDCGATVWANFQMQVVSAQPNVSEPIGFDVLPDGRVIQTDRRGGVRLHDPATGTTTLLAQIPVYTHSEDGLYGPEVDNDFEQNKWVYLYYSPPTVTIDGQEFTTPTAGNGNAPTLAPDPEIWTDCPNSQAQCWRGYFQLSRFKFVDATGTAPAHLDLATEQKIMQVPVDRGACCHVAGDIDFDSRNNLWLVTGDDTPAGTGGGFGNTNDMKTNESQTVRTVNATGGTFTLTFDGQTTAPIPYNAVAAQTQAALEGLGNIEPGDILVTQANNSTNASNGNQTVNFRGRYNQTNVPQMTSDASGLTGNGPTAPVATPVEGDWFQAPFADARRSSLSTNDLRGKVLRIDVRGDGSYSIPKGNLFDERRDRFNKTRPEIYAMGFRNPFRITLDENDIAYVTDYSPDSRTPQVFRGPPGTGRVEIVREPSNYGWPECYSQDLPHFRWNWNLSTPLDSPPQPYECDNPRRGPENTSRWNTGLTHGPAITNPDIWYSYNDNLLPTPLGTPCPAYYVQEPAGTCPQLFEGLAGATPPNGVGPHGAAPYDYDRRNRDPGKLPPYYDGAFILGEFTRDWLREVRLDRKDRVFQINSFLDCGPAPATPARPFVCDNPMDMEFGRDGNYYLLTYGDGFFNINPDAAMAKFSYVKGQRAPHVEMSATPSDGQPPLTVQFSSDGTFDPDPGDSIEFAWDFDGNGTTDSTDPNPTHVYTTRGRFTARLTVTDSNGLEAYRTIPITVGNTSPTVRIDTPVEGGIFTFGESIPYTVTVSDPEDGTIDCNRVEVTFVLGHDDHGHAGGSTTGCSGTLLTNADDVFHGGNVFGIVSASYTDLGGEGGVPALTVTDQNPIRQRRQQVEIAAQQQGTNVAATTDPDGGGQDRTGIGNGDWIRLNGPFDLANVTSLTFRVLAPTGGASGAGLVEVRRGSPTGELVNTFTIVASGPAYASQMFDLPALSGLDDLFLVFRPAPGGPGNNFFALNWVDLGGPGVGVPR
jgi:PKD repeat protein/type 1 glutamine amidotransferase